MAVKKVAQKDKTTKRKQTVKKPVKKKTTTILEQLQDADFEQELASIAQREAREKEEYERFHKREEEERFSRKVADKVINKLTEKNQNLAQSPGNPPRSLHRSLIVTSKHLVELAKLTYEIDKITCNISGAEVSQFPLLGEVRPEVGNFNDYVDFINSKIALLNMRCAKILNHNLNQI